MAWLSLTLVIVVLGYRCACATIKFIDRVKKGMTMQATKKTSHRLLASVNATSFKLSILKSAGSKNKMFKRLALVAALSTAVVAPLFSISAQAAPAVNTANSNKTSNTSESAAAASLNQYLSRLGSLQASFVQTTQATNKTAPRPMANQGLKSTHLNQKFTGTMQVKRPGQFRWETTSPSKQLIVTSGKTVWIYDPDLEQAVRQNLDDQVGNTPALLLSGQSATIMKSFRVTQPKASEAFFVLYPKADDGVFESLGIRFSPTASGQGAPSQMILKDSLGQQTTINFSNVKLNPTLSANAFNFVPPKGTDVIDQ